MFGVTLVAINFPLDTTGNFLFDKSQQDCSDRYRDVAVLELCSMAKAKFAVFQAYRNSRITKQALFNIYATQGFTTAEWRAFKQDLL